MSSLIEVLECMTVSGKPFFSTELFSATGDVATVETEPEIGGEVTGCAMFEMGGGVGGGECVGELLEEKDVFAGTQVKGKGLDVGLTSHCLCGQYSTDNRG
jgi:hypothetical protein